MTMNLRSAIDAWKEAAADAQAAQELLDQMWRSYLDSRGPAVTDGLLKEVAQFRSRAEARLTLALALRNSAGDVPAGIPVNPSNLASLGACPSSDEIGSRRSFGAVGPSR